MIGRRAFCGSVMGGLAAAPAILRGDRRRPGEKPNLLFLWTDEQRADTLAAYGNRRFRVPTLNRLAAESVVFLRCYDTQPICTPARSTVLTGLWPHQSGCIQNNIPLRAEIQALPELLNDDAYRTGYIGKWHLGDEIFPQHGFQVRVSTEDMYRKYYSPGRDRSARSSYDRFLRSLGYQPDDTRHDEFSRGFAVRLPVERCKPAFMAREAARFILGNRARPWLLHVNFLEPHMPFYGPYNNLHSAAEAPLPANYPGTPIEDEPEYYRRKRHRFLTRGFEGQDLKTRAGWERLCRNYAGLCSQVDQAISRILWALESSGQADNTILVFTSDHGDQMGSHQLLAKSVMYEEAVRVPLLLRVPFRRQAPFTVPEPVSHISLVPTLLELLGRPVPDGLPGRSLVPVLAGKPPEQRDVFSEWHSRGSGPNARAVFSADGWKLALYDTDRCLLFNRREDPLELHNLYYRRRYRPVVRRLRAKIEAWQKTVGDTQPLPRPV